MLSSHSIRSRKEENNNNKDTGDVLTMAKYKQT